MQDKFVVLKGEKKRKEKERQSKLERWKGLKTHLNTCVGRLEETKRFDNKNAKKKEEKKVKRKMKRKTKVTSNLSLHYQIRSCVIMLKEKNRKRREK